MTEPRDRLPDGPVDAPADGREHDGAAEHELRVLLARTVPNLPTPLDRMGQVRERVRRRRRRQRALGTVLTVTAIACGGLLLPEALTGDGRDTRPMVAESSERTGPPLTPAAPRQARKTVSQPTLAGMELSVPVAWHTLGTPDRPGEENLVGNNTVYLSTQPLTAFPQPCTAEASCLPMKRLRPDGVLVQFGIAPHTNVPEKVRELGRPLTRDTELYEYCKELGGAYGYSGAIGGVPDPDSPVFVNVCAGPGMPESRLKEITEFMAQAVFHGPGKTSAYGRDTPDAPPPGASVGKRPGVS
ncbi:hypothetical protein ACWDR0_06565 [Streptomyces sp. NPDC003691]